MFISIDTTTILWSWSCVKSVQIRNYFWSVFQSESRKKRTRNSSVFGRFSRSVGTVAFVVLLINSKDNQETTEVFVSAEIFWCPYFYWNYMLLTKSLQIYLFIYLFIYSFIYLFIYLFVFLFIWCYFFVCECFLTYKIFTFYLATAFLLEVNIQLNSRKHDET